ncbi:hypothetical protein [Xanthomonas sacchari]|nr:hypothetical protein [Xanthomonas sacchari]
MNTWNVENVIDEIEDLLDHDIKADARQLERWAIALRNALKEDAA